MRNIQNQCLLFSRKLKLDVKLDVAPPGYSVVHQARGSSTERAAAALRSFIATQSELGSSSSVTGASSRY